MAPLIAEHWGGGVEVAVATALVQRNHCWLVVISEGDAIQVPSETVRTCPLPLVPDTVGLYVATGALVMIAVEAVKTVVLPKELIASTRARRYFPISELLTSVCVVAVEGEISLHPVGTSMVVAAESTWLVQTNHW